MHDTTHSGARRVEILLKPPQPTGAIALSVEALDVGESKPTAAVLGVEGRYARQATVILDGPQVDQLVQHLEALQADQ